MIAKRLDAQKWLLVLSTLAALIPLLFVSWFRTLTLYGAWAPLSLATVAFISAWYIAFLFGLFVPTGRSHARGIPHVGIWVCLLSFVAAVGAAVMTYEFAIVRGFGFSTPINDLRVIQVNQSAAGFAGSWLGGLGRSCVSAIVVAWILACLEWRQMRAVSIAMLVFSSLAVFVYQAKFEGGRFFASGLLLAASYAFLLGTMLNKGRGGSRGRVRRLLNKMAPIALLAGMFFIVNLYNANVSMSRSEYAVNHNDSMESASETPGSEHTNSTSLMSPYKEYYISYASSFDIDTNSLNNFRNFDRFDLSLATAWIYLTQGMNEFNNIIQNNNIRYAYGFYQFSQISQIITLISGKDFRYDISKNLPNVGTYITLPGAFFVDFGPILALIFPFFIGLGLRRGLQTTSDGSVSGWTVAAPLIVMIVAIGAATSTFTNFWTCFVWIGIISLANRVAKFESVRSS